MTKKTKKKKTKDLDRAAEGTAWALKSGVLKDLEPLKEESEFGRKGSNSGTLKEKGTGIPRDVPDKKILERAVKKLNRRGTKALTDLEIDAVKENMSSKANKKLEKLFNDWLLQHSRSKKPSQEIADGGPVMSSKTKPKSKKKHGAYAQTGIPMMGGGNVRKPAAYRNRMYNYGGRVAKYNNK